MALAGLLGGFINRDILILPRLSIMTGLSLCTLTCPIKMVFLVICRLMAIQCLAGLVGDRITVQPCLFIPIMLAIMIVRVRAGRGSLGRGVRVTLFGAVFGALGVVFGAFGVVFGAFGVVALGVFGEFGAAAVVGAFVGGDAARGSVGAGDGAVIAFGVVAGVVGGGGAIRGGGGTGIAVKGLGWSSPTRRNCLLGLADRTSLVSVTVDSRGVVGISGLVKLLLLGVIFRLTGIGLKARLLGAPVFFAKCRKKL